MVVEQAPWWRRHPVIASLAAFVSVGALVGGIILVVRAVTAPELSCGPGMVANASSSACVGLDLGGGKISDDQPERLTRLMADVDRVNAEVSGDNYVALVLLLNLSPVENVDTTSHDGAYRGIEGAVTAVWRANHTSAFSGSQFPGEEPKVKLFLANMGSENADWEQAVDQIAANADANHITTVVGLGQSTANTRRAVRKLTVTHRIPVIGATVTGDTMNYDIEDGQTLLKGFFRVAPTNSDTVAAAARYITEGLRVPMERVAIVEDTVASDDYVSTLVEAAHKHLGAARRFQFSSPDIDDDVQARAASLRGQFGYLNINLCDAEPKVVYFAGRGADLGTFARTWLESGTACANRPLVIVTGDDGLYAVNDDDIARVVGDPRAKVRVQFTGLASPGKWGDCATAPDERTPYDQFESAFTGKPSCGIDTTPADRAKRLAYPLADLNNGQAILTHDATALAVTTARRTGRSALTDRMSQVGVLLQTRCRNVFHGASGDIRFSADQRHYGNPIGAVLPVLNITGKKASETVGTGWSTGGPSPTEHC